MGLMMDASDMDVQKTPTGYGFSNQKVELLGASEFVIGSMVIDVTGSTSGFDNELKKIGKEVLKACLAHPKSENFLLRTTQFNDVIDVNELHGFLPVSNIDESIYDGLATPCGGTPLMDATLDACEALIQFGNQLAANQYIANAVLFVITDGGENSSMYANIEKIKRAMGILKSGDPLESFTAILIGVNDMYCKTTLIQFQKDADFDDYKSIEDADPNSIAKIAKFISKSMSTASLSLNGGNSKNLSNSIASLTI